MPDPARGRLGAARSILITRPEAATTGLASRITSMGYRPVVAPLLSVRQHATTMPGAAQAILVTSSNALPSLRPVAVPLFAVGDATAARAIDLGFADVRSAGRDALALAALVARSVDPAAGPLLLASGAGQGLALAEDLRGRGFRVLRRVCYAAVPVRRFPVNAAETILSGDAHAILFLSAETASVFVRLLPPGLIDALGSIVALAIGQTTLDALEPLPWLRACRARNPTLDDVLALI